jgi:hypothetical protein
MRSLGSKWLKVVALLAMAMLFVTCKTGGGGDISLTISPTQVYALPISAESCSAQYGSGSSGSGTATGSNDLSSPTLAFNRIKIDWHSTSTLQVAYLQLTFTSPAIQGGSFSCYIANDELLEVFYANQSPTPTNVTIDPSVSTTVDNYSTTGVGCSVRCGSIPLVNQHVDNYISGIATVIGVAIDADGNETPEQGQAPVAFQWQAIP